MKKEEKETAYWIRFFNNVRFKGDWELDIQFWRFQLRIGYSQIALWKNFDLIWQWLR